jgi:hypothetical protein
MLFLSLLTAFAQPPTFLDNPAPEFVVPSCPGWAGPCEAGWQAIGPVSFGTCTTPGPWDGVEGILLDVPGMVGVERVVPLPATDKPATVAIEALIGVPNGHLVLDVTLRDAQGQPIDTFHHDYDALDGGAHTLMARFDTPPGTATAAIGIRALGQTAVLVDRVAYGPHLGLVFSNADDDGTTGLVTDAFCQAEIDEVCDTSLCSSEEQRDCDNGGGELEIRCFGSATPDGSNCEFSSDCRCANALISLTSGLY